MTSELTADKLAMLDALMGTAANLLWQNLYQLNHRDRIIVDLRRSVTEKDYQIADLTKQLIEEKLKVEILQKNASSAEAGPASHSQSPVGLPQFPQVKIKSEVHSESEMSSPPMPFSVTPTWPGPPDPDNNHHEVWTSSDEVTVKGVIPEPGSGQNDAATTPPPPPTTTYSTLEVPVEDVDMDNGKENVEMASSSGNSDSETEVTPLRGCPEGGLLTWRSKEHGRVNRTKEVDVEDGVVKTWWYCRCGKSFRFASGLTCHVNTREKRWKCVRCEKRHTFFGELAKHLRRVHSVEVRDNFGCHLCGITFQDRTSLFKHRFTHTLTAVKPTLEASPTSSRKKKKTSK